MYEVLNWPAVLASSLPVVVKADLFPYEQENRYGQPETIHGMVLNGKLYVSQAAADELRRRDG